MNLNKNDKLSTNKESIKGNKKKNRILMILIIKILKNIFKIMLKNDFSIYPEIKGTKCDSIKLEDIKNFLISEINSPNKKMA